MTIVPKFRITLVGFSGIGSGILNNGARNLGHVFQLPGIENTLSLMDWFQSAQTRKDKLSWVLHLSGTLSHCKDGA